jgi:transposase
VKFASNISIEDFSFWKQKIYYSIIEDNDTRKRLEVIPPRNRSEVVDIFKEFPRAKNVTIDFSKTYRKAIIEILSNVR